MLPDCVEPHLQRQKWILTASSVALKLDGLELGEISEETSRNRDVRNQCVIQQYEVCKPMRGYLPISTTPQYILHFPELIHQLALVRQVPLSSTHQREIE